MMEKHVEEKQSWGEKSELETWLKWKQLKK